MKKNLIFAFVFVVFLALPSYAFDVVVDPAPGNFYVGEGEYVLPVKVVPDIGENAFVRGNYTIELLAGPAWLVVKNAPDYDGSNSWDWHNQQNYWMDVSGIPASAGPFSGRVRVCSATDITQCVEKAFSDTILESTRSAGLWAFSWDPAASYAKQIEINTQFKNTTNSSITLSSTAYYDYYMTIDARTTQPKFDFWFTPDASQICLQVLKCGNDHYVMRHRVRKASIIPPGAYFPLDSTWRPVETSYQQMDSVGAHYGMPTDYLSDKLTTMDSPYDVLYYETGTEDWSYPAHDTTYQDLARLRHPKVNERIVLFDNGTRVFGEEPPAWAANNSCSIASLANGDFLVSDGRNTTYEFCDATESNTPPTLTFSTAIDTIYSGEDYVAFPAFSDADGDSVWLSLVSGPSWIEVGTPADYLDSADWPHKYGNSLYYIRSVNTEIRRHALVNPGLYTYSVQAHDKNGAVSAVVSHQVKILPAWAHPSAVGKNLGVLMGDETWFRKYQLDIASGVVNFSGGPVVLTNFYYDYYGYKAESPNASVPHYWYSDSSITPNYAGCGNGRFRIRYQYSGTKIFNSENSYFDNKAGIVFGSGSIMNKRDDWSMLSFADTSRSRRYAANMPLYNGDGTLLWGTAPTWAESCGAHPPTLTFSTVIDTIYSGEDYVAFPAFSDADDDSVWLSLVSGPAWIEVGTPADYLDSADWPHKYGNSFYYVRSVNTEIRRHALVNPGLYTYSVQAHDQTGAVSTVVSHQLRILPASAQPSAVGKNLGVLVGDETWFRRYQLDIASGVVNFSGGPVTLTNFYYDYYGYKAESPNASTPHYWYSDSSITPGFVSCGEGRFRIRYQYSGTKTFNSENSYFDNKAGFVYGSGSIMNKRDDWSMLSFADTSRSRHYAANMPLYNGDGTLLWGTAPSWSNACGEELSSSSSSLESSSSWNITSSSAFSSSSSGITSSSSGFSPWHDWMVRFYDSELSNQTKVHLWADVVNGGNVSASLLGYTLRFYYNSTDVYKVSDETKFDLDNNGSGQVNSASIERCGVEQYAVSFVFGTSAVIAAGGTSNIIQGSLHDTTWKNLGKSSFASWTDASSLSANPRMALFDPDGNLVYGTEAWTCNGYQEKELKLSVVLDTLQPISVNGVWQGGAWAHFRVQNEGDSSLAGPVTVSYYVRHPAGQVPVLVTGTDTLSSVGLWRLSDNLTVVRNTSGDQHVFSFTFAGGLPAASSRGVSLVLYDACIFDCGDDYTAKTAYIWDLSDDWSALDSSGTLLNYPQNYTSDKIVIKDNVGNVIYGKANPSAPSYAIVVSADGDTTVVLRHPRAIVDDQTPNRTDALEYAGGQLLSGGDFEEPTARGWDASGTVSSMRAKGPQGSRYLEIINGSVSQPLPAVTLKILQDSGAVLTVFHKGSAATVSLAGVSGVLPASSSWREDTLRWTSVVFASVTSPVLSVLSTGTLYLDNAVLVPGSTSHSVTYAVRFTTTQHEELETRAYDGDEELLVTTSDRDAMGRPWKKFLPFALACSGATDCNSTAKTLRNPSMSIGYYTSANPDYPDAQGYPYAETQWKPDQAATKDVEGAPGKAFGLLGDENGVHVVRAYSSGVNLSGVNLLDSVSLSNAVSAVQNSRVYDNKENYHAQVDLDPTHFWELSVDPDGRKAFTVKDGESRVIVSGALDGSGHLLMRSVNELDARGNVIKSHPPVSCEYTPTPAHCVTPSTFEYDSESRVIASTEPDAGETRSYYDPAGRVRATQTQRQIDSGTATVMGYDGIDRAIYSGVWTHGMTETQLRNYFKDMTHRFDPAASALDSATLTENFYDRMPARDSVLTALGVELYPSSLTADSFKYTKTRLVATVSRFRDWDGTLKGHSVAYRHDKKGRVIASYVYNGGVAADSLKLLATETEYDLSGKVLKTVKYPYGLTDNGRARKVQERYTYDRRGRVDTLYVKNGSAAETVLATYEYYPTGSVKQIALGGGALTLGYTYHISGAVKTATARNVSDGITLYSETLDYEDCGKENCTPQYAGNISRMMHSLAHGNTNYSETRDVLYAYDLMNRLTNVNDASTDLFDEVFAYDPQGRILSQRRGANVSNAAGGDYSYYAGKNRLVSVSAGMSSAVDSARIMNADSNFVYDADGNMIYDASKKMTVSYDWRGLPTEFAKQELSGDSVRLLMTYDASGNRITKRYERKTTTETAWTLQLATHYTGLGSEIRENGLDNTAKVVVNLPQGLGRYGVASASENAASSVPSFEWYLKNHLGSTLLVYGTGSGSGSVKAAYDYRAFGEQVSIVNPSDKVTENFTGKELDDETDLGYFGARYLDQMLGMWVSVDTKRQFASPFLYAGNGVNPIIGYDPDGNYVNLANKREQQLGYINQASYNQYTVDKRGMLQPGTTCYEKGNPYYSERIDAAIKSENIIYSMIDPVEKNATSLLNDGSFLVTITGKYDGNSSPAQNLLHELVSHAIPLMLGDRDPAGSAMEEENKAIKGVFPVQKDIPDHLIDERLEP